MSCRGLTNRTVVKKPAPLDAEGAGVTSQERAGTTRTEREAASRTSRKPTTRGSGTPLATSCLQSKIRGRTGRYGAALNGAPQHERRLMRCSLLVPVSSYCSASHGLDTAQAGLALLFCPPFFFRPPPLFKTKPQVGPGRDRAELVPRDAEPSGATLTRVPEA